MSGLLRVLTVASFTAAGLMVAAGGILVATAANAEVVATTGNGILSLDAAPAILADDTMSPGDRIYWPITANLNAASAGHLTLKITSSDALATDTGGLRLAVASCPVPWTPSGDPTVSPSCTGGLAVTVVADTPLANVHASKIWNLGTMPRVSARNYLATISLPSSVPARLQGASGDLQFSFTALGDTVNAKPSDPGGQTLAFTGLDPLGPALLAAGLLLAGFTLARVRSRARMTVEGVRS